MRKDPTITNDLIEKNLLLAKQIVDTMHRQRCIGSHQKDDCYGVANMTLCIAAQEYDSTRNDCFAAFATMKIKTEVFRFLSKDNARGLYWVGSSPVGSIISLDTTTHEAQPENQNIEVVDHRATNFDSVLEDIDLIKAVLKQASKIETEIIMLLYHGYDYVEIGDMVCLTLSQVKYYVRGFRKKINKLKSHLSVSA